MSILSGSPYGPLPAEEVGLRIMGAFQHIVQTATLADPQPPVGSGIMREAWKPVFWAEVATVAKALLAEKDLEGGAFTMSEWLDLRVLTISGKLSVLSRRFILMYCYITVDRCEVPGPLFRPVYYLALTLFPSHAKIH